jgi:hypothetical protein
MASRPDCKNKEGPPRGPSAYLLLRLLAARAVTAAAAGGIAGLARVVAAIALVGHVWMGLDLRLKVKKRGYFVAPREIPAAITRGYASTRRCSDCTG